MNKKIIVKDALEPSKIALTKSFLDATDTSLKMAIQNKDCTLARKMEAQSIKPEYIYPWDVFPMVLAWKGLSLIWCNKAGVCTTPYLIFNSTFLLPFCSPNTNFSCS